MAGKSRRPRLQLSDEEIERLKRLVEEQAHKVHERGDDERGDGEGARREDEEPA